MRKQHGINEETITDLIKRNLVSLFTVFADEGEEDKGDKKPDVKDEAPVDENTDNKEDEEVPSFNYEDLISKARKEEKDKLYPKINSLEKEREELIEKHNKSLLTIGELQSSIEDSKSKGVGTESEKLSELAKALKEKEDELKILTDSTEDINTVEERIRKEVSEEYEIKLYREQKLREVGEEIIPELVMGETKEDIDNSVKVSQARFNDIVKRTMSGVSIPPANTSNTKLNNKDFNMEDLARLDPKSDEYKEFRTKMGLK